MAETAGGIRFPNELKTTKHQGEKVKESEIAELKVAAKTLQPAYMKILYDWDEAVKALAAAKERESELRMAVYQASFDNPQEGTNSKDLCQGWVLKAKKTINRKMDESQISAIREQLAEAKGSLDSVVEYKPKLSISGYKKLPPEHRKIVDAMITEEEGTPQLEIVLPAKKKK